MKLSISHKWLKLVSLILLAAILVTNFNSIVEASNETADEQEKKSSFSVEDPVPGVIAEDDCPDAISFDEIEENGHIQRLHELEKDLNTIVFQNGDGSKTLYYFAEPVKYVDNDGNVKDKGNALVKVADKLYADGYSYTNVDNDIRTYFPSTFDDKSGVLLEYGDVRLELNPTGAARQKSTNTVKKIQVLDNLYSASEAVSYDGVFGRDSEIRYTPMFNGFKESIVLNSYNGINQFSFTLKTNGLCVVEDDGLYYLANPVNGKHVVSVGALTIIDSSKNLAGANASDYNHHYTVKTITEKVETL